MALSAVVLAAGAGTRMKSKKPKVAHAILGKAMVNYAIDAVRTAGADTVAVVVGHGKEVVEPLCEGALICEQKNMAGTGDAVMAAREALKGALKGQSGSCIVTYGDCPLITSQTLANLVETREKNNASACVLTMQLENPFGYGRIVRDSCGNILKNVEEKDCTEEQRKITECNTGFYCFDAGDLFEALAKVKNDNAQGEYYLTDVIEILANENKKVVSILAEDETELLGVNSREQLNCALKIMQARINKKHMDAGVTLWDVNSTYIGPDVEIEPDVEILPNVILTGKTKIGQDCKIGPNTRLENVRVGKNCVVDETIGVDATIEDGAMTGPRCYLRPGAHLMEGAKAGTCVEIKKSVVGKNSKVPHLSYVGDATIGENVNLGAGTITCNYDGVNKNKAEIGNDTFIGSSTMLVSPVKVGSEVIIGAGSVITEDVPDNALAFGRARQVNKLDRIKHE